MKFSAFIASAVALSGMVVHAYPGMGKVLREIQARQDDGGADDEFDSNELIGDLVDLPDTQLTVVGHAVKSIILDQGESGESDEVYRNIPIRGTAACAKDTCCIWHYISADMTLKFRGLSGRCTSLARGAVRLGFHDAAGWSKATAPGGGADGSIILADVEMTRPDNRGLEEIVAQMKKWYTKYKSYGISMADLIQMGANTATVVCPLGPRVRTFVGRKDSSVAAPDGLLPSPFSNADTLISLFQDKTIRPHGLAALLGSHTTSQQRFVNTTRALDPQDSTPGVWDVLYYKQTLDPNAPPRVFKFPSDVALSKDPRTGPEMAEFAGPGGQEHWNEDYAREYVRVSLLGVYNINNLTECTKVLPPATKPYFNPPDASIIEDWVKTTKKIDVIGEALADGSLITSLGGLLSGLGLGGLFP
ncbi:peroxidase [Auriculariales sp. MPI-PUGE-AT-0066]|nr:peroxidase [Auriculariales sp. MPI-PUGE-AT-0066]